MQAARRRGARVALEQPFLPEQLPSILAQTECLVIPSEWMENAPLSALQARAAAVPIVASDVPGLREVVEPDRHGWLFAPGDVEGLARRLEWLVRSGPRRLPQSSLPLSLDEHLERLEALYEGVRVAPRAARVKTLSRAMGVV